MTARRLPGARLALVAAAAAVAVASGSGLAAGTALDLTGTWKGFSGTLALKQKGTALTGTFAMAVGCTETYTVAGSLAGTTVSLTLARASGKGDAPPCAAAQTMKGTASASSLSLDLVNRFRSSPATAFARVGGTSAAKKTPVDCTATAGAIAFQSERDGNAELYVMGPDGGAPQRCTDSASFDGNPAWSPDGSEIAFRSDRSGNPDIWLMPIRSGAPAVENLTRSPGLDDNPSFSPDGSAIVFESTRTGDSELWTLDIDTGALKRLTTSAGFDGDPAWSPDGTRIAWERGDPRTGIELWVMQVDGTGARRLTSTPGLFNLDPAWTVDSKRIVFNSSRSGVNHVWVMNADGSGQRALTTGAKADVHPAVAPAGGRVAFASARDGAYEIYAMTATGGAPTRLTTSPGHDLAPSWRGRG